MGKKIYWDLAFYWGLAGFLGFVFLVAAIEAFAPGTVIPIPLPWLR